MTSLPDRLSVVRPQWEAQLDAFHALTTRALDSAEQLFVLNIKTSRASVEQATGTLRQMLHASDPRDLLAIGSQAQGQWQQMFSYSRELLGIAMGARERNWSTIPMPVPAPMPIQPPALLAAPVAHVVEQAGIAIADATTVTTEIATAAAESNAALAEDTMGVGDQTSPAPAEAPAAPVEAPTELGAEKTGEAPSEVPPEPDAAPLQAKALDEETSANVDALVDIVIADEAPPAKAKPLVEALNDLAPKPVGAEHPIASTVPLENGKHVELPPVAPLDTTPPVQLSNGPAPERRRASRKKS
ncbi:phasin family protein [Herbaspirillum sp. SJZ107]|uniref:phasin family protein n=1 Tax=Herbaspirillum sp. SJZ107 TaxID=2572881 RepID=UPI001174A36F|nr:phasin family protein [Herbaspirillum sp. SJZ107]TQK07303.1 phasin protein [Herbaspirillum sp. SJZ107]